MLKLEVNKGIVNCSVNGSMAQILAETLTGFKAVITDLRKHGMGEDMNPVIASVVHDVIFQTEESEVE